MGGRPATSITAGESHLFWSLEEGQAYVRAEARPVLHHWEGAHEFHVSHPGSGAAVVKVHMAPSGLAWRTGDPRGAERPWTHADLACGIGGFTVAAQSLGASTTWACGINREATQAYNVAHAHARTSPGRCHPIELRSQWAHHVGTDLVSAGFLCQAFTRRGSVMATWTREARSSSTSSSCVGCCDPASWSWDVCVALFCEPPVVGTGL